ncbi:MAG: hypothetical protein KDA92_13275 [Planctomycetales bacterium]|nr:hypothetical protein [Planctomycetales bacterium]
MTLTLQEQRIAALMSVLGNDVAGAVMQHLPQDAADRVQNLIEGMRDDPMEEEELEEVLDEFMRFFRYAVQQHSETTAADDAENEAEEVVAPPPEPAPEKKPFRPTGDPFLDLVQLEPYQIAGALKCESPRTIAVVLNCLPPGQAGLALQHLPEEVRANAFLILRNPPITPPVMLQQMVRTTVSKGCVLDASAVADPADEANKKMAELLRAMEQAQRAEMVRALEAKDPELLAEIKKLLYTFEDLRRIHNRSIQKILGEIDSQSLAMALKGADPELADRVMGNLSKRARATLAEEIEFLGSVKPNEQVAARQAMCDIIGRLDESGDLEMET